MSKEINSDLIRGNINTIILKALYAGDRYGYDIVKEIETKSHGQYTIKQPTLYSCLKRLEAQGFVSSYWGVQSNGGRRKYFSLTDMGKEVFKQSQDDYEYSRTIIDKLISEDKYDLGNYETNTDKEAVVNFVGADSENDLISSSDVVSNTEDGLFDIEKSEVLQEVPSDSDNKSDSKDNSSTEQLDNYWKSVDDAADETLKRKFQYAKSDDNIGKTVESFKNSNSYDIKSNNLTENPILDNSADLADIFKQASGNSSYFSDIQSIDVETQKTGSNSFFSDFVDLVGATTTSSPSVSKTPYKPTYSDEDYPYSDEDFNAAQELEKELLPESETKKTDFISYHDEKSIEKINNSVAVETMSFNSNTNEYIDKLSGLIDKFGENKSDITKNEIKNNAVELDDKVQIRVFGNIVESARELGEEIKVRTNDVQAKRDYVKFYYRDNFLRLFINAIVFAIMLTESLVFYTLFKKFCGTDGQYDVLVFSLSILVAVSLPIYAGVKFYKNPESKKRIETNFRDSIVFRVVVMVLVALLSFGINLFMGMPLSGNITNYLISLFLPIILSTNFLVSAIIFKFMHQLTYFTAKD